MSDSVGFLIDIAGLDTGTIVHGAQEAIPEHLCRCVFFTNKRHHVSTYQTVVGVIVEYSGFATTTELSDSQVIISEVRQISELVGGKIHTAIEAYFYSSFGFLITMFICIFIIQKHTRDKKSSK